MATQLSALDFALLERAVPFGKQTIKVYPLTADSLIFLMAGFANIRTFIQNKNVPGEDQASVIAQLGSETLGVLVAACTVERLKYKTLSEWRDDVVADSSKALQLPVDIQLKIIEECMDISFSEGLGPFAVQFSSLLQKMGLDKLIAKYSPNSQDPNTSATTATPSKPTSAPSSRVQPSASLDTGGNPRAFGRSPLDKSPDTTGSSQSSAETN